jgi:LAO/AO transport system kinase
LLLPGAGDELQGIKRGVVEMADMVAINKADGNNLQKAKASRTAYRNGLHMFPAKSSDWTATAMVCSATENTGITEIWKTILQFQQFTVKNEFFDKNRNEQAQYWLNETIQNQLKYRFENHILIKENLGKIKQQVQNGEITPFVGAELLMNFFFE